MPANVTEAIAEANEPYQHIPARGLTAVLSSSLRLGSDAARRASSLNHLVQATDMERPCQEGTSESGALSDTPKASFPSSKSS